MADTDKKMTKQECLELELINTKKALAETQFQGVVGALNAAAETLLKGVSDRLGIDITKYQVELSTGNLKPIPDPQAPQQLVQDPAGQVADGLPPGEQVTQPSASQAQAN